MDLELRHFINLFPTPVRIVTVNADGRPVYSAFNNAALLDAGLQQEDIQGFSAIEIYPGTIGRIAYNRHLTVIKTAKALSFDMDEETTDGQQWIRTTLAPIVNDQGAVEKILCTQIDITAEKRMHSVESDAEKRVQEMENYLAMAAHDLRSPMVNVRLIADFILEDFQDLDDGKLQMLEKLQLVADKAMSLISDVLSHAMTTTLKESKTEVFSLDELCSTITAVLDPLNKCSFDFPRETIAADKVAVQIAIRNLIDNALKHNEASNLHLCLSVEQKNHDFLEFFVSDNGKGFADSALLFIETGELTSESGFGLAGVSRLIRNRGGDIRVVTEVENHGANIAFTFPGVLLEQSV